jgi:hypothetical protein
MFPSLSGSSSVPVRARSPDGALVRFGRQAVSLMQWGPFACSDALLTFLKCLPAKGDLTDRLGRTALSFDAQAPQGPRIAILHDRRADAVICSNWDCDGAVPRFRCNGSATEKLLGTVPQRYRWFLVSAPPSVSKWANIESINGSAIAGRNPGSASNIADPRSSIV